MKLPIIKKNKGNFLPRTSKVKEKKVPSAIRFFPYWLRYGRFKILAIQNQKTVLEAYSELGLGKHVQNLQSSEHNKPHKV